MLRRQLRSAQAGWLSLPIIVLLLAATSLADYLQRNLLADYQWRSALQSAQHEGQLPQAFQREFIQQPKFHRARLSSCEGFCPLSVAITNGSGLSQWGDKHSRVHYLWSSWQNAQGARFYRLCASQNQQIYLCWWWREQVLVSRAWLGRQG